MGHHQANTAGRNWKGNCSLTALQKSWCRLWKVVKTTFPIDTPKHLVNVVMQYNILDFSLYKSVAWRSPLIHMNITRELVWSIKDLSHGIDMMPSICHFVFLVLCLLIFVAKCIPETHKHFSFSLRLPSQ